MGLQEWVYTVLKPVLTRPIGLLPPYKKSTGFVQEAYFKEDFFFLGTFFDTAVYSMLQQ
jgi:hypothetical protein